MLVSLVAQLLWLFWVLRKIGDRLSKLQNGVCCLLISLYDILTELLVVEGRWDLQEEASTFMDRLFLWFSCLHLLCSK